MSTVVTVVQFIWAALGLIGMFMVLHVMFDWAQFVTVGEFLGGGFVNIFDWFRAEF